jgi:signal transduction histidine kinase
MRTLFSNLREDIERFSALDTDYPGEKRRKVTLVLIAMLCCLTGIMSGTRSYFISEPIINILLPYTFTTVVGIALIVFFFTKRFAILLHSFLLMILCIPVIFQCGVGGYTGDPGTIIIIFWSILAPFGSLMFQNARKAMWWFTAYIILVIISLYFDSYFREFIVPTTYSNLLAGQGIGIIALSITIFLTMLYFVKAFQREHARAENLVIELTDSNSELELTLKELKETQSELVQSEKLASLGKLAAGIAHEINNPVGALMSSADISTRCISKIEQSFDDNDEFSEIENNAEFRSLFQIIKDNNSVFSSATNRLADTVNSFINFARLDGAEFDKVDINHSIDNTLTLMQPEIKGGTSIVKEYGDIPKIACYPGELNQVFMNLLTKSAQTIGAQGKITIRTYVDKGELHIQIADTGSGISRERLKGLFDPGFRKKGSTIKADLGLFSSYNIVKKHKGRINVESELGKGSSFTVVLPTNLDRTIYGEQIN